MTQKKKKKTVSKKKKSIKKPAREKVIGEPMPVQPDNPPVQNSWIKFKKFFGLS